MGRLEAKQVLLYPLISSFWFLCNKQDLLSWKLPSCKITFAWNSQLPAAIILQQIFKRGHCCLPPHPHQTPILVSPLSPSWAHFLVLLQCGICQGWLSQSRETECTLYKRTSLTVVLPRCRQAPPFLRLRYKCPLWLQPACRPRIFSCLLLSTTSHRRHQAHFPRSSFTAPVTQIWKSFSSSLALILQIFSVLQSHPHISLQLLSFEASVTATTTKLSTFIPGKWQRKVFKTTKIFLE